MLFFFGPYVQETPLGVWEFRSKSRQDICSPEGGCRGYMFSLEVIEELEAWPEQENHCRRWVNINNLVFVALKVKTRKTPQLEGSSFYTTLSLWQIIL